MDRFVWVVTGFGVGALILWGVGRALMPRGEPLAADQQLPATALQRSAWWSLGLGVLFTGAAAILLALVGVEGIVASQPLRIIGSLLALGAMVAAAGGAFRLAHQRKRAADVLDERDRAILERAPAVQSLATILALALWTVALTERFWAVGQLPLSFLQLVFWSCVLVNLLSLPVGVLIGYRRL